MSGDTAKELRLAMLGMVDGNGHPYSWSAICNGYDRKVMAECPYPTIPQYLGAQPPESLGIPGVKVTHIWTDDPKDARHVSRASLIPNVVEKPEDVIGEVDGVCIATDIGYEHVDRARPFIEADVPVFIDKPLTDNEKDLAQFIKWYRSGKKILSTSCMRYAREVLELKAGMGKVGDAHLITAITPKSWERYGIHAMEGLYQLTGPGFVSVRNVGVKGRDTVLLKHESGVDCVVWAYYETYGSFGIYHVYGSKDSVGCRFADTFYAFKTQLETFVKFLRTGRQPFDSAQTFELMRIIIGGILSRERGGTEIKLQAIAPQ